MGATLEPSRELEIVLQMVTFRLYMISRESQLSERLTAKRSIPDRRSSDATRQAGCERFAMSAAGASLNCHAPRRTAAYGSKADPGKPSNGVVYEFTPAGKRRRHHLGRSIAWSRRQTKAAAGRQSLRRRQTAQMAQTKEGQSSRSIHSLTPDALSSGQQGLHYLSGLALAAIMIAWI